MPGRVIAQNAPAIPLGYAGYRYGMSMSEAEAVSSEDRVTQCPFGRDSVCLARAITVEAVPGDLLVLFGKTGTVAGVLIEFSFKGQDEAVGCLQAGVNQFAALRSAHGDPHVSKSDTTKSSFMNKWLNIERHWFWGGDEVLNADISYFDNCLNTGAGFGKLFFRSRDYQP
jgi:hypothetical protein